MQGEFFTIEYLGTIGGMVAAVLLLVQFTKGVVKRTMADYAVRILAAVYALVVQAFVLAIQGQITLEAVGLGVLNSILVTLAATGAYETIADPAAVKKKISF